jgi:hypothetical protein
MATVKKNSAKQTDKKSAARKKKLSLKQENFVENYLANGGNATQAARDAGYSEKTAYQTASENLRKPEISERIQARLNEAKVTSDEVVGTLAAQMRAKITDVLPDDGGLISQIKKHNLGHLIRKIKVRRELDPDSKKAFEVAEIELYSAQAAAVQLAKILGIEQEPQQNQSDFERERQRYERLIELHIQENPGLKRAQAIKDITHLEFVEYGKVEIQKYITG